LKIIQSNSHKPQPFLVSVKAGLDCGLDWTGLDWTGLISDQDSADGTASCKQQKPPKIRQVISRSVTSWAVEISFLELQRVICHMQIK